MSEVSELTTSLSSHDLHHIWVRDMDLTADIMGHLSFAEVVYLLVAGRLPAENEKAMLDAVLVALMEHGLTPSAMVARTTYWVAPEAIQGAVAAGLLGVGSKVLGPMEECGRLLTRIDEETAAGAARGEVIERIVGEYRDQKRPLPGIGHVIHTEGDPRAARLYEIAEQCQLRGRHLDALLGLQHAAEARAGRRLPLNVTGATAGILLELGIPWQLHRGFALISRSAGLVAHIGEELEAPITPGMRKRLIAAGHKKANVGEDGS